MKRRLTCVNHRRLMQPDSIGGRGAHQSSPGARCGLEAAKRPKKQSMLGLQKHSDGLVSWTIFNPLRTGGELTHSLHVSDRSNGQSFFRNPPSSSIQSLSIVPNHGIGGFGPCIDSRGLDPKQSFSGGLGPPGVLETPRVEDFGPNSATCECSTPFVQGDQLQRTWQIFLQRASNDAKDGR